MRVLSHGRRAFSDKPRCRDTFSDKSRGRGTFSDKSRGRHAFSDKPHGRQAMTMSQAMMLLKGHDETTGLQIGASERP